MWLALPNPMAPFHVHVLIPTLHPFISNFASRVRRVTRRGNAHVIKSRAVCGAKSQLPLRDLSIVAPRCSSYSPFLRLLFHLQTELHSSRHCQIIPYRATESVILRIISRIRVRRVFSPNVALRGREGEKKQKNRYNIVGIQPYTTV